MHYSKLSVFAAACIAVGSSLLTAQTPPPPDFNYLLTEGTVTLSYTLATAKRGPKIGNTVKPVSETISISHNQVLRSLQLSGVIPDTPAITSNTNANGWSIVAVRAPASDIAYVTAAHDFYAVNTSPSLPAPIRVRISPDALGISPKYSTHTYTEKSIGQYTIGGGGTMTSYVELNHNVQLIVGSGSSVTHQLDSLLSWGNASLVFISVDEPVFYYPVSSLRLTGVCEFSGTTVTPAANVAGLGTMVFTIGTPKLVYASRYPETAVQNVEIPNPFPFIDLDVAP